MEDDNNIIIEDDIVKAIIFYGGISGTTSVLVDAENHFGKRSFKENQFQNQKWSKVNICSMLAEILGWSNKVIKCECSKNYSIN